MGHFHAAVVVVAVVFDVVVVVAVVFDVVAVASITRRCSAHAAAYQLSTAMSVLST